jgi:multicomponent Na+:H+ antiporter subunit E
VVVLSREAILRSPAISISGFVAFLPFFLLQSLRGGWESAQFAIQPGKKLHTGFIKYSTSLPSDRSKLYFLHVISLLPGTVSAAIDGEDILVHALDTTADHSADLRECEKKVAALFGLNIEPGRAEETASVEDNVA